MCQQQFYETVQRQEEIMEITKLATALVKAQAEMDGAKKDSANPFFKSKYADLSSVAAAIGPAAAKFGLGYVQVSHNITDHAAIETVIIHESGESLPCGVVSVPVSKDDAQGFGSAMTYARRYSLSAAFGVCPEDDDGNAATKAKPQAKAEPTKQWAAQSRPITPNDAGKDFWNSAEGDEAEFLKKSLNSVVDLLAEAPTGEKAAKFFYSIGDELEKAAVWSKLNSQQRKIIVLNKQEPK